MHNNLSVNKTKSLSKAKCPHSESIFFLYDSESTLIAIFIDNDPVKLWLEKKLNRKYFQ